MNKEYFDKNEKKDYERLVVFNEKTNLFNELHRTPEKHFYDVSGKTRDGRKTIIELKDRNLNLITNEEGKLQISEYQY